MAVINYLTTIQFGFGVISTLAEECARVGITRPLLVTDKGVRAAGLVDRVTTALGTLPVVIFDETPGNPNEQAVRAAVTLYKQHGCDGVVAVGGGSAIDLAKGVAVCATHEGSLKDFAVIEGGLARITTATAPVIAVPTTAGTGSEVGRGAILILDDGRKVGVISPYIIPKSAVCDPELTMGLPQMMTAATGMDAIAHCIETFLAPAFNPPADGIALDGLRRAWRHIEKATYEPGNRDARMNLMIASTEGALAFQKGLGCVHSLSHSLGGINPRLHHGTLNAVFLPAVIRFNASADTVVSEDKMARLAEVMRVDGPDAVAPAVQAMRERLGLPRGLTEMGVSPDLYARVVDGALADHSHKTNPRDASREDYLAMLQASA
ncbi:MAG: iron-containing alcohol dehydrogenase [Comamonadaceae bacterium]|nr:MAG: iron-containing alcohol dehydrogenase [Comamonadaceae bacterium]